MIEVNFREATHDDLNAIVRLLADDALGAGRETASDQIDGAYLEAFDAISNDPHNIVYVAVQAEKVVGCLQLTLIPNLSFSGAWRGQIEGVRIDKSLRGSGVGKEFFKWTIEKARQARCKIVQLTMNSSRTDSHFFYESLGFEATHTGFKLYL